MHYHSGERVNDITFWKSELVNEIRAMENETDNLQVQTKTPKEIKEKSDCCVCSLYL